LYKRLYLEIGEWFWSVYPVVIVHDLIPFKYAGPMGRKMPDIIMVPSRGIILWMLKNLAISILMAEMVHPFDWR